MPCAPRTFPRSVRWTLSGPWRLTSIFVRAVATNAAPRTRLVLLSSTSTSPPRPRLSRSDHSRSVARKSSSQHTGTRAQHLCNVILCHTRRSNVLKCAHGTPRNVIVPLALEFTVDIRPASAWRWRTCSCTLTQLAADSLHLHVQRLRFHNHNFSPRALCQLPKGRSTLL